MGDITGLHTGILIVNEKGVNEELVEGLEGLLKLANDGEIVGITGSLQYSDDAVSGFSHGHKKRYATIGALTCIINRLVKD